MKCHKNKERINKNIDKKEIQKIIYNLANSIFNTDWTKLLDDIKDLQKKAELGEHYKNLYSSVKKQKDDVIEYIKTTTYSDITGLEKHNITEFWFIKDLLRMLGEIDEINKLKEK